MTVKIHLFKGLSHSIENHIKFLKELSWVYKKEQKVKKLYNQEESKSYISKIHQIFFRSNLGDNVELWYSKLSTTTKKD